MFLNGSLMSSKAQGGLWEPNAPAYTLAGGILFKSANWKFGVIDKVVGQQYSDAANLKFYKLPAYNDLSATIGYAFGNYEVDVSADNLLGSRAAILITEATNGVAQTNPATSLDQYFFQSPMSVMVTLKAHY